MKNHRSLLRAAALLAVAITQFAVASRAIAQTTVSLSVTDSIVAETWPVEASPEMATWAEIGTNTDPEEFVDVDAGDSPQRFYRFRQVTPAAP